MALVYTPEERRLSGRLGGLIRKSHLLVVQQQALIEEIRALRKRRDALRSARLAEKAGAS